MVFIYSPAYICAQIDIPARKLGPRYTHTHTPGKAGFICTDALPN